MHVINMCHSLMVAIYTRFAGCALIPLLLVQAIDIDARYVDLFIMLKVCASLSGGCMRECRINFSCCLKDSCASTQKEFAVLEIVYPALQGHDTYARIPGACCGTLWVLHHACIVAKLMAVQLCLQRFVASQFSASG
jgi:hypothetical protein